jgi:glycosyltransferase involved in cell wall biosynthesis
MRVALVTSAYPPHLGGVERHVQRLAQSLAGLRCEVEVLTQAPRGARPSVDQESDGLVVRRWPASGRSETAPVSVGLFQYLRAARGRYDVVHAHNYHSVAPAMSYLSGRRPLVVSTYLHARPASFVARVVHVPYGIVGRRMLRAAASVIALSRSEADMVAQRVPGVRPVVVPSGIDRGRLRAVHAKEKAAPVVLFVGRLTAYKGAARVIEAVPFLGEAQLVVVGSGPEAATLRRLAERPGFSEKVQLTGPVDDDELARWYATADVVISMSSYESFGIVVLEGLAAGTRVVASDIPAHRDMRQFDEYGALRLVPLASSPEEIAKVVLDELAMGRCMPSSTVPSWETVAQLHLELYEAVLRRQLETPHQRARRWVGRCD